MLPHLSTDQVQIELGDEARGAMILNNLDATLLDLVILNDFVFEVFGVEPLHVGRLRAILGHTVVLQLVIEEFFNERVELLRRLRNVENELLMLLDVVLVQ